MCRNISLVAGSDPRCGNRNGESPQGVFENRPLLLDPTWSQMVCSNSILQKVETVSQRILIGEIGTQGVLFVKLDHCFVDYDSSTSPESIC